MVSFSSFNQEFKGYEYQWLYPTGIFKRDFKSTSDLNFVRKNLPTKINDIIDDGVKENYISRSNQVHYYILNLNAREMKHN